jgi:hypothetical protein
LKLAKAAAPEIINIRRLVVVVMAAELQSAENAARLGIGNFRAIRPICDHLI